MSHMFKVRQMVRLNHPAVMDRTSTSSIYEVVRLMPADQSGEFSYRIKSGSIERAVRESEIRCVDRPAFKRDGAELSFQQAPGESLPSLWTRATSNPTQRYE